MSIHLKDVAAKVWDWSHVHTFIAGMALGSSATFIALLWLRLLYWMHS